MDGCLEIGGSHLGVALIDPDTLALTGYRRHPLDATGPLEAFVDALVGALADLPRPLPADWAVALPGPFDYAGGIGGDHPSGKLRALAGHDCRALLAPVLGATRITFVNDALAFGLGCAATSPATRLLGLTFGSGIGSAFVEAGRPVTDARVPPGGEVYALPVARPDRPPMTLEARFGPAALARRHGRATFADLAAYARTDPGTAAAVRADFAGLADALGPWLRSFTPTVVACGGGVVRAWDLFGEAFTERLRAYAPAGLEVRHIVDTERLAMQGAAAYAQSR